MKPRLVIREEAEADIVEAYLWYAQRLPRLGKEFLEAIDEAGEAMLTFPERFPTVHEEPGLALRRVLLKRFPYGVLFIWDAHRNQVSVLGCLHARRDPNAVLGRL